MFTLTTSTNNIYHTINCACGNDIISNEGNTGSPYTQCRDCYSLYMIDTSIVDCTNCHSEFESSELTDGVCDECISLVECEECRCIDEILTDGLCQDCIDDINDVIDTEGPVCYGYLCFDDNLADNLCEDCLEVVPIGEKDTESLE